ncbi:MAG: helix-turn-helix transcriptional regulator [Verrucomicrobiota bacterium]
MSKTRELRSRAPMERMVQIHNELVAKRFPNCTRLMEITGVGRRTVLRDLDFMRDRMRLPIDYYHPEFGYWYTKPVDRFPLPTVTEREVFALFVAHSAVNSYRGTPFAPLLRGAFKKLAEQLDNETHLSLGDMQQELSFRPFAPDEVNLDTFDKLSRSVRNQRAVRFTYKALGKVKPETRTVQPHHLACVDNRWYAISYDEARNGFRNFVLTRMSDVVVLERTFRRQKGFSFDTYMEGSFGIFQGGKPTRVVAEFRDWAADLVKERRWHPTQAIEDLDDGGVRLGMTLTNLVEVERWLLGWGDHVTVLEPKSLRDRMAQISRAMLERHS